MNGVAQIALGDLYYIPYFLDVMDLSIPYTAQCLTFLTPEALTDNSWQTLVLPFRHVRLCNTINSLKLLINFFTIILTTAVMRCGQVFFFFCFVWALCSIFLNT